MRRWPWAVSTLAVALVAAGCGGGDLPRSERSGDPAAPTQPGAESAGAIDAAPAGAVDGAVDVVVDVDDATPIPPELLGTNVPAWLGPERLGDPDFVDAVREVRTTLVRMPGGSWSNVYDWLGCELGDEDTCVFDEPARPSDFAAFLTETRLEGMWTVSANSTAESAAALVAFFNGETGDDREIGVDRDGVDWQTVGYWAGLRESGGHPAPIGITWWEFGNEVYGGRPETGGSECASFGWEEVWTCDGTEYVTGTDDQDGYLAVRAAMRSVDPSISVGAVGIGRPGEWSSWGDEVIAAAGDDLDFYVVHEYGFDRSPDADEAAARPAELWEPLIAEVDAALGDGTPVGVTEYNLVSFEAADTEQTMTTVMNALYIADSIGRMARAGVDVAAQWNFANGVTGSGTDYGLVDADTYEPLPAYHAVRAWGTAGSELLGLDGEVADVAFHPTRDIDGSVRIVVVHVGDSERTVRIGFDGVDGGIGGIIRSTWADDPRATEMTTAEPLPLETRDGTVTAVLPPYSVSVVEVSWSSQATSNGAGLEGGSPIGPEGGSPVGPEGGSPIGPDE